MGVPTGPTELGCTSAAFRIGRIDGAVWRKTACLKIMKSSRYNTDLDDHMQVMESMINCFKLSTEGYNLPVRGAGLAYEIARADI